MSNVIKYNLVYIDKNDKKIVDCNNVQSKKVVIPKGFINFDEENKDNLNSTEFVSGISAQAIEQLVIDKNEQPQIQDINIDEVKKEAEKIIEDAKQNAVKEANVLKQKIFDEAKEEGYSEGYNTGVTEIRKLKQKLKNDINWQQQQYNAQLQAMEGNLVEIIIGLLEKITGILIEDKKEVILHLINRAIEKSNPSKEYIIEVSDYDYEYVVSKQELLNIASKNASVDIIKDNNLVSNQCIIKTDSSIINCSLDIQLKGLIEDLKLLARI